MTSESRKAVLVWLRNGDLRLSDNPALYAASGWPGPCIPVYIHEHHDSAAQPHSAPGAASRWWLHRSLEDLACQFEKRGSRLTLRTSRGSAAEELLLLASECGAGAIYWNDGVKGSLSAAEQRTWELLERSGLDHGCFRSNCIFSPAEVLSGAGKPYQVFTPYYKACLSHLAATQAGPADPLELTPEPAELRTPKDASGRLCWPASTRLEQLGLLPALPWYEGMEGHWQPGEAGAQIALAAFLEQQGPANYPELRDQPAISGTSRLSPYLHFGNISPRQIWHACREWQEQQGIQRSTAPAAPATWQQREAHPSPESRGVEAFLRQLIWREFAHQLLHHFPHTADQPLREEFRHFPWAAAAPQSPGPELLAWKRGQTGYPIVDAAMRELWHTGWMHNRCRMIVASFLCKHLLIPWQEGAAWFWDTLVDADLANNTLGWQWTAGCGADAAPYFRIFNPVLQSQKFDPAGSYIRRWCPELAALPDKQLHAPWTASPLDLAASGLRLVDSLSAAESLPVHRVGPLAGPGTYPLPIVEHGLARDRALAAYDQMRSAAAKR
ncbi:deoxyribodipyrimidine photo-lyase [bacterium]|nr:deoxyribodipyrimidine photo-lyase [bacterium]